MKKMTKLLLINWHYFSKELVECDSINFLTGKNKSGKSTIIDALQVVLMGETRGSCFNRAANKKSDRSLKSYLIGSMGEDIDDGKKSLRGEKDFTTYIVAELFDDVKGEFFCLGASFDSFADGSDERKRFFWMRSSLPHEQFIQNNRPMDTRALKGYLDANFKNKSETRDTNDAYQKLLLARLNIHDPRMFSMLKSAISFEPINDIEKFITDNVCHIEENINIEDMQQTLHITKSRNSLLKVFLKN